MADREKILVWLNCYCPGNDNPDCGNCPFQYGDCAIDLPKAIKNLLQEPVKPKEELQGGRYYATCGNCGYPIAELTRQHGWPRYGWPSFCSNCGREVLWN